ncbi:MAG TPA: FHA domain-containing protein [Kofleriaceae bacterium]|nr:FHA domain-containing protein [Kofleriaceae bacterium]
MRCVVCGHESPPGSSFCLNCGSALAPAVQQTPVPVAGLPIFCSACHGENPPGMKFCRACGTQLAAPSAQTPIPLTPLPAAPTTASGTPAPISAARAAPSTIICPRCGTSTPTGFAYCQQCGLHIQPIAPTDPGQVGVVVRMRPPSAAPPVGSVNVDAHSATMAQPDSALRPSAQQLAKPAPMEIAATRVPSSSPSWGSAVLVNRDGSDGQRFALTSDDTVLGRTGADIAFDDDRFLARQHARLERTTDGAVRIHALDTLNGVFKKTDAPVELVDGAVVLVGREVLRFEKVTPDEKAVHPLVRHGVALFGSPPREPWGRLMQIVPSGGYRDVRHLVTDEIVLGREEGDIVFRDDAFMSRRHAAITLDARRGVASITDLGSSNGTFVRISGPTTLKHGDHVRLGDQLLRVELSR